MKFSYKNGELSFRLVPLSRDCYGLSTLFCWLTWTPCEMRYWTTWWWPCRAAQYTAESPRLSTMPRFPPFLARTRKINHIYSRCMHHQGIHLVSINFWMNSRTKLTFLKLRETQDFSIPWKKNFCQEEGIFGQTQYFSRILLNSRMVLEN